MTGVLMIPVAPRSPVPGDLPMFLCQTMAPVASSSAYTSFWVVAAKNTPAPAARVVAIHPLATAPAGHPALAGPFSTKSGTADTLPVDVATKPASGFIVIAARAAFVSFACTQVASRDE